MLLIHSDHFEYKVKQKAMDNPEELSSDKRESSIDEVLVVFCTIEKIDEKKPVETALKSADSISEVADRVKSPNIMIYPYAHLSHDLGSSNIAVSILKNIEKLLIKRSFNVFRSPFGWYKSFEIKCKGHPLAETSRSIIIDTEKEVEEETSQALQAEEKLKSSWYIIEPDGDLTPVENYDFTDHENLRIFMEYEIVKSRTVSGTPPHVTLMKRLGIADYEPGSDPGNLRWYPKGKLIKSLLEQYVTTKTINYGAMEVETPIMYDMNHPSLADYLNRFPARQYTLRSSDRDFFLRFSACFGQFLILNDTQISYRQLPLRIYELTRYSFRKEKRGELAGLRRLRAFTMPDCHALCRDMRQAKEEAKTRFKLCMDILENGLELNKDDYELALRFTRSFYDENKDLLYSLSKLIGKPALVEVWDEQFFYFVFKWEFNFVDNSGKASALSTDQIDTENAKRYGITFTDENGENNHPLILHCSPSGAVERCVYALLENAYKKQKEGLTPILPLWLSPTQVRIIPLSDSYVIYAKKISKTLDEHHIRNDIDDRSQTVSRKVRDGEMEWINYIIVIGQKEVTTNLLSVRDRELGKTKEIHLQDLIKEIANKTKKKPYKPLSLPKLLTNRAIIAG